MELSQFNLEYHPRIAIKAQALADFVVECSFSEADDSLESAEAPAKAVVTLQQQ